VAAPRMDRKLAAIMAVDVVGYSRLIGADEAGTLARVKAHRVELAEPLITEYHGRVVKLTGDGALVEFASAVDAVECAVAIQSGMAEREAAEPEERRIRYRIGINVGDIVLEDGDIFGDGVNVAARLEGLAEPGGICIARNVYNQVKGKLDLTFEPMGEHRVKNIAEPVTVYRVLPDPGATAKTRPMAIARALRRYRPAAIAAAVFLLLVAGATGWYSYWRPDEPLPSDQPSIAVLPFDNLGGDESTGRLADGITEDIITDLARFRGLIVIARNSTLPYKDKPVDVRQIGEDLNVRFVLEGSIQRQADRVRVTAQLIDAAAGAHVWSERWDRPAQNVFAVQTELAESVANRIGGYGLVAATSRELAKRKRPENLTAYDLYLLGSEAKHRQTEASLQEAIRLYHKALDLDPHFARAWTGLSWAYRLSSDFASDETALRQKALDAARRALQLDPMDAEAHVALADAVGMMGNLPQAEVELERALQLNPNADIVLSLYAAWASSLGEPQKGAEAAEKFIRMDPNYPTWATGMLSYAFFHADRYEDCLQMLAQRPDETMAPDQFISKAGSLAALGRAAEAKAVVTKALARFPDISIEDQISRPDFADHERQRYIETMRKAGFPACAKAEELAQFEKPVRLPECDAERAKRTTARS
jgi:TolB-like protein/class 3 adenylate cyclase/cytochrome c-type biogenesis protein CcmH/NrfG